MNPLFPEANHNHAAYMRTCIELALKAKQRGDSPVGSVLVRAGEIIAMGIEGGKTHQDITYHAEIEAIRQAVALRKSQDLSDCIMYTTHEPCIMCSYVIRHTGINTVVMALLTGEIGGYSSPIPLLLDTTIQRWPRPPGIIKGIMEKECKALLA